MARPLDARRLLALATLAAGLTTAAACASRGPMRLAEQAERRSDYDRAVVEYTNALRQHPNDTNARLGLERAKLRAATDHFQRGRRLSATGKFDQALVEYQLASELNPTSREVDEALNVTRTQLRSRVAVAREG